MKSGTHCLTVTTLDTPSFDPSRHRWEVEFGNKTAQALGGKQEGSYNCREWPLGRNDDKAMGAPFPPTCEAGGCLPGLLAQEHFLLQHGSQIPYLHGLSSPSSFKLYLTLGHGMRGRPQLFRV